MIQVNSEIGNLQRLIIHSPDSGLGKVVPSKAQDWLFEDIVQLDKMRKEEYDVYVKLLLYFLDKEKVAGKLHTIDAPEQNRSFYKPDHADYFASDKVLDTQYMLAHILKEEYIRREIVASISALERCTYAQQKMLLDLSQNELAKTLISGSLPNQLIFAPLPNFIFTRDLGIVINNHLLMNKPAKTPRLRESFLAKYIFHHHPVFESVRNNIIELDDVPDFFLLEDAEKENQKVTVEGGDVMMVAPNHLLIGISERTSINAVSKIITTLFDKKIVEKVTTIRIPAKRDFMHIDTIFTQVRRDMWVVYGKFGKPSNKEINTIWQQHLQKKIAQKPPLEILQFCVYDSPEKPERFTYLEELLDNISREDLKSSTPTQFVYSGGNEFPYSQREQWTDACNVLALKEGVVIGYDRNKFTARSFQEKGFRVVGAMDLLQEMETGITSPETIQNTLIELPSAELSRARGGSHCMSMPLLRSNITY